MNPKLVVLVSVLTAVAGCSQTRPDARPDAGQGLGALLGREGGGQVIEPKRCALKVLILPRPLHDKAVETAVWSAADEQVLAPETRRVLQANGLRVGVITGGLPADVETAVNAPPPDRIDPAEFNLPDGDNTLVSLIESAPQASLLLNRDGRAFGRDYKDASGWFRVTATQDGATGVALRFVPEVHHGPVQRRFDSLPNGGGNALNPMQFMVKDGQQEETLRDLAATLTLQPGQVAAIGCDPDRRGSLGYFLFTQPEANSDRLIQKVVLVWASRNASTEPGSQPKPSSRLFPVEPPGADRKDKARNGG
jgi:hypothetical protein